MHAYSRRNRERAANAVTTVHGDEKGSTQTSRSSLVPKATQESGDGEGGPAKGGGETSLGFMSCQNSEAWEREGDWEWLCFRIRQSFMTNNSQRGKFRHVAAHGHLVAILPSSALSEDPIVYS